jgi:hypothetical protein
LCPEIASAMEIQYIPYRSIERGIRMRRNLSKLKEALSAR